MRRILFPILLASQFLVVSCGDDADPSDAGTDSGGYVAGDCGNGSVDGDELCDGSDLNDETCSTATRGVMSGGTLSCNDDCTFDVSACTGEDDSGTDEDDGGVGGAGG